MYGMIIIYIKGEDQPGEAANPARSQVNRENEYFPCPRSRLRIWSRKTGSAVPSRVSLLISILRLNLVLTYGIPPEFRGGAHFFFLNRHTPSGQSRVYRVLGRSPWTNQYAPLFPTPPIGMRLLLAMKTNYRLAGDRVLLSDNY